jgi:hypothetical protein
MAKLKTYTPCLLNFCFDENIQTIIFGTKLEDLLNYRIDYNSVS